jgi:hypothetical protein
MDEVVRFVVAIVNLNYFLQNCEKINQEHRYNFGNFDRYSSKI